METLELTSLDGLPLNSTVHAGLASGRGTVLYAHGITADVNEFGFASRFAERLAAVGPTVLRFSFRGHGGSGGTQRGMTIAGEMLDLETAVEYAHANLPAPISVVASSFGAVSTLLSLPWRHGRVKLPCQPLPRDRCGGHAPSTLAWVQSSCGRPDMPRGARRPCPLLILIM